MCSNIRDNTTYYLLATPPTLSSFRSAVVQMWDQRSKYQEWTLKHDYQVLAVALSDDSTQIFTGGLDDNIYVSTAFSEPTVTCAVAVSFFLFWSLCVPKSSRFVVLGPAQQDSADVHAHWSHRHGYRCARGTPTLPSTVVPDFHAILANAFIAVPCLKACS